MQHSTKSVLAELDQLRSMLKPVAGQEGLLGAPVPPASPSPLRQAARAAPIAIGSSERGVDRLGRAIEAAEEEVEAALRRTEDMHATRLRQRELEVAELQRCLAARERELDGQRASGAAARRGHEQQLRQLQGALAARDSELSGLRAEVLALRAEKEELSTRCQQGLSGVSRAEAELHDRTAELTSALHAKSAAEEQAVAAAARERKEKELLMLEVVELRRELSGLEAELGEAQRAAKAAGTRAHEEFETRRELESQLRKAATAAHLLQKSKDLELAELSRRLRAERAVRKACERWLKSELKSRDEMDRLLLAVRDVALGKGLPGGCGAVADQVQQVEALLESMGVPTAEAAPGGGGRQGQAAAGGGGAGGPAARAASAVLGSSREAEQHRQEFAKMKSRLCEDSRRLKAELAAAKQLLHAKVHGD